MKQSSRFGYRQFVAAGVAVFATSVIDAAMAQIPGGLPSSIEPGRDRPQLTPPAEPKFDFRIETPGRSSVPRAVDEIRFRLNGVEIKGAATLPVERFQSFYQPLIGKDVTLSDVLDVASAIENEYRRAGYVLVRAFVPPQRVTDGIFTITVVEGFIANVSVDGGKPGTRDRIQAFLEPARASRPLALSTVERGLLLANDLPGVTATGVLRPSPGTPGASDLVVTVPDNPVTGSLAIDNRGSRFSGLWSGSANLAVNSVFDDSDQLSGGVTGVLDSLPLRRGIGQLRYRRPVGEEGALLSLNGTVTHGEPGSTLQAFQVLTDSWAVGPRISFPLKRTRQESLVLEGGFTAQDAQVDILGSALSHDRWRVIDLGASYLRSDFLGGAWAVNVDVAQGLPIWGASANGAPDLSRAGARTDFTKISGGFRFTRPLVESFEVMVTAQGQYAFAPLVIGEQIAFGGLPVGRGYDLGALTGDHGLGGSIELRYNWPLRLSLLHTLQPYAFFDAARVWNVQHTGPLGRSVDSVGGGVRAWMDHGMFVDLEVAQTLEPTPGSDGGKKATKLLVNLGMEF